MFTDEIDHLYAAMLGERPWSSFLERLVRDLPGGKATLQMYDSHRPEASFVALQTGFEPRALTDYGAHYVRLNLLQQALASRPTGRAFADDALVPPEARPRDPFFNEWLAPNEVRASAGLKIQSAGGRAVSLVLLSGRGDAAARARMVATLDELAPHLHRVSAFYRSPDHLARLAVIEGQVLDRFDTGMVMLGGDGRIGFLNEAARQMLEARGAVLRLDNSRLQARDPQLAELLSRMMSGRAGTAKTVDHYSQGLKLTLIRPQQDSMDALFNSARLVILMSGIATRPPRFDRTLLARTYQLTAAEMRAAEGLVSGLSAAEIASASGRSRETIRVQIRSLYAKTGARSQADILRLVRPR